MKHLGTRELETNRLYLRRFELSDAKAMYDNWASDAEVTKYLMWKPFEKVADSENVLKDWIANYSSEEYYQWAIVLKDKPNEPIGCIGVSGYDNATAMIHVGYSIGKAWWNKGITSEALNRLIDFFFDEVEANRVESRHDPRNVFSGKVMEKCGMKYEGTLRMADWNNQGICDASYYAILKSER